MYWSWDRTKGDSIWIEVSRVLAGGRDYEISEKQWVRMREVQLCQPGPWLTRQTDRQTNRRTAKKNSREGTATLLLQVCLLSLNLS